MFVVVHHQVRDPATFWSMVLDRLEQLPEGITMRQSLPTRDAAVEFSLWETLSVESLREFIEEDLRVVSTNTYYPIEAGNAVGLPGLS